MYLSNTEEQLRAFRIDLAKQIHRANHYVGSSNPAKDLFNIAMLGYIDRILANQYQPGDFQ